MCAVQLACKPILLGPRSLRVLHAVRYCCFPRASGRWSYCCDIHDMRRLKSVKTVPCMYLVSLSVVPGVPCG